MKLRHHMFDKDWTLSEAIDYRLEHSIAEGIIEILEDRLERTNSLIKVLLTQMWAQNQITADDLEEILIGFKVVLK